MSLSSKELSGTANGLEHCLGRLHFGRRFRVKVCRGCEKDAGIEAACAGSAAGGATSGIGPNVEANQSRFVGAQAGVISWYVVSVVVSVLILIAAGVGSLVGLPDGAVVVIAAVPLIVCGFPVIVPALIANGLADPLANLTVGHAHLAEISANLVELDRSLRVSIESDRLWDWLFWIAMAPYLLTMLYLAVRTFRSGKLSEGLGCCSLFLLYAAAGIWACEAQLVV